MDGQSLLAAVLASPDDDMPRLIYADWLDEQGECDRAEFIRAQCRIASLDDELFSEEDCEYAACPGCEERRALRRRERELLCNSNWLHWADPAPAYVGRLDRPTSDILQTNWQFRRGFVEAIECGWADCAARLDAILAAQPVRRVALTTWPDVMTMYDLCRRAGLGESPGNRIERWCEILERRWPGVEFTLPLISR